MNTDCDIYLHTGENLYKRKKKDILHLSRVPSGFSIRGGLHVFVLFSTVRCDTLVVGILVTTPWMCECVRAIVCVCVSECVNLWKLYYANCYLNFF